MTRKREFDLIVWGATGYTGRLVARYLAAQYGTSGDLKWALGGRNPAKLEAVRQGCDASAPDLPLVVADSRDSASLQAMAQRTEVICSTVGPFARYGSGLVAACARHGTHYCDITGEAQWIRRMIDAHREMARASGARLVPCCGFDAIPSDLGTLFAQNAMNARHGVAAAEVKLRIRRIRGKFSGGTVASLLTALEESAHDPQARWALDHPYSLYPEGERSGPPGADVTRPTWDPDVASWVAPFVMATINSKVVRRSNALMDYPYGREFRYGEGVMTGHGPAGWARAAALTAALGGFLTGTSIGPLRTLMNRLVLPQPGEGPSTREREDGLFEILVIAKHPDDAAHDLTVRVTADRDPGYGATSRMLAESAVCLARDPEPRTKPGGFWTPASCLGMSLLTRLQQRAGIDFRLRE